MNLNLYTLCVSKKNCNCGLGRLLSAATATIILLASTSIVWAATITPTVGVTGTVSAICKAGTTGSLTFTIDPSLAGPISATVTDATVFCSNGTPFSVTAVSTNKGGSAISCVSPGITGTLKDASNNLMDYTFMCSVYTSGGVPSGTNGGTGQGHGSGKDVRLGLGGTIAATSYQNAPVSTTYGDTITLTITY